MVEKHVVKKIYDCMQDDISKKLFVNRLNYCFTQDTDCLEEIVNMTLRKEKRWSAFCQELQRLKSKKLVIFGAGIWGNILYKETSQMVKWNMAIDNSPKDKVIEDLPVISANDLISTYAGEIIVISSYKNSKEMLQQLSEGGIKKENIINAGEIIFELTEKAIYFDFEEIMSQNKTEYFVDAGCFDGLTTKQFFQWCNGNGYSYCFEPDEANIERIQKNLRENFGDYEIIKSAVWSRNCILSLRSQGNYASSVSEESMDGGDSIEAVSLDFRLAGKEVTFIKMDIEGAELEALKGAKNIIKKQKPRLAISVYHRKEDIWEIPQLILNICPDYKFYLRHYSFGDYDTVLYAVCDNK